MNSEVCSLHISVYRPLQTACIEINSFFPTYHLNSSREIAKLKRYIGLSDHYKVYTVGTFVTTFVCSSLSNCLLGAALK